MWRRSFPIQHAPTRKGKYKSLQNIFCRISFLPPGRNIRNISIFQSLFVLQLVLTTLLLTALGAQLTCDLPSSFCFNKPFSAASFPISFGNSSGKARGTKSPGRTGSPRGGTELAHVVFASGLAAVRCGREEDKPSVIWNTEGCEGRTQLATCLLDVSPGLSFHNTSWNILTALRITVTASTVNTYSAQGLHSWEGSL